MGQPSCRGAVGERVGTCWQEGEAALSCFGAGLGVGLAWGAGLGEAAYSSGTKGPLRQGRQPGGWGQP